MESKSPSLFADISLSNVEDGKYAIVKCKVGFDMERLAVTWEPDYNTMMYLDANENKVPEGCVLVGGFNGRVSWEHADKFVADVHKMRTLEWDAVCVGESILELSDNFMIPMNTDDMQF